MPSSALAFFAIFVSSLALAPTATHAQQAGKVYHIGHVPSVDFDRPGPVELRHWSAFVQSLRNLGWIEGKNFVFERRLAMTGTALKQAAEDFVRMKVDVIVVSGGARTTATDNAARQLGLRLHYLHFDSADELPAVFAEIRKERDGALLVWEDPAISELAPQILDLALKNRMPTMVDAGRWARLGALNRLRPQARGSLPSGRDARRSYSEGCQARRSSDRSADHVRADL